MAELTKKSSVFSVGETLDLNGKPLKIVALLDDGYTGTVYRGELFINGLETDPVQVAVKAVRDIEIPGIIDVFTKEGMILSQLNVFEEEAHQIEPDSPFLKVAPHYYGFGKYDDKYPFLVMEFLKGHEIPDLIMEKGKFDEPTALLLIKQLYQILNLLHKNRKAYRDMKFNNLWVDEERSRLRMLDFGTLEEIKADDEFGIRRDVLLAGVYACAMLTGYTLRYSTGRLKELAEPVIQNADDLSWGTKKLLHKLLHRNPEKRITNSVAVMDELKTLVRSWNEPVQEVITLAESNYEFASKETDQHGEKAYRYATRARIVLEIVKKRPLCDEVRVGLDLKKINEMYTMSDYLERGKRLFGINSYQLARTLFDEGKNWSDNTALLRSWSYLSSIGEKVPRDIFQQYHEMGIGFVDSMEKKDWRGAETYLNQMKPSLESDGLRYLEADLQLAQNLFNAENAFSKEDFATAALSYHKALEEVQKLPDAKFIFDVEVGNLLRRASDMDYLQQTRGKANQLILGARNSAKVQDWKQVIDNTREAFEIDPDNIKHLDELIALVDAALDSSKYAEAAAIALAAGGTIQFSEQLRRYLSLAQRFIKANRLWYEGHKQLFLRELEDIYGAFKTYSKEGKELHVLVAKVITEVQETEDMDFLVDLASTLEHIGLPISQVNELRQRASQVKNAKEQDLIKRHKEINGLEEAIRLSRQQHANEQALTLIDQVKEILQADNPAVLGQLIRECNLGFTLQQKLARKENLTKVVDMLINAEDFKPKFHIVEEIQKMRRLIIKETESMDIHINKYKTEYEAEKAKRIPDLIKSWKNLHELREWSEQGKAIYDEPTMMDEVNKRWGDKLKLFIQDCVSFLAVVDGDDKQVQDLYKQAVAAMDRMGYSAWHEMNRGVRHDIDRDLQKVELAYAQGDALKAAAGLDDLAPRIGTTQNWLDWKARIMIAVEFVIWTQKNIKLMRISDFSQVLIEDIRKYLAVDINLPKIYWKNSQVPMYLQSIRKLTRQRICSNITEMDTAEFVPNYLIPWFISEMTCRQVNNLILD